MPLCHECASLDLPTKFKEAETSTQYPILSVSLSNLTQSAHACSLCSLLLRTIEFQNAIPSQANPADVVCKIFLVDYGTISPSDKSGARLSIEEDGELVRRLIIHLQIVGQRDIHLPIGIQEKAEPLGCIDRHTVLKGRLLSPQVDMKMILQWINTCSRQHGALCKHESFKEMVGVIPGLELRVIDVENLCIVSLSKDENEYAALSYVWGGADQLRLYIDNHDDFTKPFGLKLQVERMPQTIQDSLTLVKLLGMRYLWVDALCIIQDDKNDLAKQIQQMNIVYSCAAVTIVAAAGKNANAGLPGVSVGSREPCRFEERIEGEGEGKGKVEDLCLIPAFEDFANSINNSVWESRGWTMQEKVLSKRLLLFTDDQIYYHCNMSTRCEDAIWEYEDPDVELTTGWKNMAPHLQGCSLPPSTLTGMRKYAHLVRGYHPRQLTDQRDALDAFSGALTAVAKEMNSELLWGFLVDFFDDCLMWKSFIHNPAYRREGFPSWSWLGWKASDLKGQLTFQSEDWLHVETVPIRQWFKIGEDGGQITIKKATIDQNEILPPINLANTPLPHPPMQHILRFTAQSASLFVGREAVPSETNFARYGCSLFMLGVVSRTGEEVTRIGTISLSNEWRQLQPDRLEFILVCKCNAKNRGKGGEILGRIELMLVESKGDISYRVQMTSVYEGWWAWARPEWRVVCLA